MRIYGNITQCEYTDRGAWLAKDWQPLASYGKGFKLMCQISQALIESINFLPEESRLQVLENFRKQFADYSGEKIIGYIPRDKSPRDKRINELSHQGMSIKGIAKLMKISRNTIRLVLRRG